MKRCLLKIADGNVVHGCLLNISNAGESQSREGVVFNASNARWIS